MACLLTFVPLLPSFILLAPLDLVYVLFYYQYWLVLRYYAFIFKPLDCSSGLKSFLHMKYKIFTIWIYESASLREIFYLTKYFPLTQISRRGIRCFPFRRTLD